MFETTSRYYPVDESTITGKDGKITRFTRRRFIPGGSDMPLLAEVTVVQGDRLDTITARTLGDPLQYWRVCDANDAMRPRDLSATAGRILRITVPRF
jgi:hypothetical protein